MIQIINESVTMPSMAERKFQKEFKVGRWVVVDSADNSIRYRGAFENVVLACHNLNKAFYKTKQG